MRNPYYLIWADCIACIQSNPDLEYRKNWKINSMFIMTLLLSLNLLYIWIILHYVGLGMPKFVLFENKAIDENLSFACFTIFPALLINYFFVFYNERWKVICKNYKPKKLRKAFLTYFLLTLFMFVSLGIFAFLQNSHLVQM